jgi:hypothetical protein
MRWRANRKKSYLEERYEVVMHNYTFMRLLTLQPSTPEERRCRAVDAIFAPSRTSLATDSIACQAPQILAWRLILKTPTSNIAYILCQAIGDQIATLAENLVGPLVAFSAVLQALQGLTPVLLAENLRLSRLRARTIVWRR